MSDYNPDPVWEEQSLGSLAEYHNGVAFKPNDWGVEGLPIVRIEQINDPSAPTDRYSGPLHPNNRIDEGDLVFSWSATLKTVIWRHGPAALNQHLFKVEPRPGVDQVFLKHLLDKNMDRLASASQGSTMKHITRRNLDRFRVMIPARERDQRRIADILSTVDEAIEQTEALIAKTQQIKTGLMHDLFTRGVTPDGRLRPPRDQAPELYKQSPLGWIPRDWDVAPIGRLVESWAMGPRFSADEYTENGSVATLRTTDMDAEGNIDYCSMPRADLDLAHLSQHLLRPGDLVVSRSGTCGIAGVFGGHSLHVLPGAFLIRFRFDSVIRSDFVRDFVNSPFGVRSMLRIAEGGVQKNLRGTEVCRVMLPVPRRLEQAAVCSLLQTAVLNQETCRGNVRALQKLKSGLTRVLLSPPLPLEGN